MSIARRNRIRCLREVRQVMEAIHSRPQPAWPTLEVILDEQLAENSRKIGKALLARFQAFVERFEFVGDARGRGLMLGVELVKNKKTKERVDKAVCGRIFESCMDRGLLSMTYTNPIRIIPPLTISRHPLSRRQIFSRRFLRKFSKMAPTGCSAIHGDLPWKMPAETDPRVARDAFAHV